MTVGPARVLRRVGARLARMRLDQGGLDRVQLAGVWLGQARQDADEGVATCVQCGELAGVCVEIDRRDLARCSCRLCRAVFWVRRTKLHSLDEVVVARRIARRRSAIDDDVPPYFPAIMAHWLRDIAPIGPVTTRTAIHRIYTRFDSFADQARTNPRLRVEFGQLCGIGIDEYPADLPDLNTMLSVLGGSCYDTSRAVATLAVSGPESARPFLVDRVEAVDRWLRIAGHKTKWTEPATRGVFRDPDPDRLAAMLDNALAKAERQDYQVLMRALFGTDRGPTVRMLREIHTDAELLRAVAVFQESGQRPLLNWALAVAGELEAPEAPEAARS